ncbi:MAG TPA: septum formation initiator family protein [Nakamurella sp.]
MSEQPQRRPGSGTRAASAARPTAAGGKGRSTRSAGRGRAGSSRPAASRPAAAPGNAAPGTARRTGRTWRAPALPGRSLMPRSALARQVAMLGLVLCAVALSVAFPLRNYLEQRAELGAAVASQQDLEQQRAELQDRKNALLDNDYVAAEARRRLQFVTPGDTVFLVHAPALADSGDGTSATPIPTGPWYGGLWDTLTEEGQ